MLHKMCIRLLAAFLILSAIPSFAFSARPVRIKLATLAPKGTAWYDSLLQMKEEWSKVSGGTVQLTIYPGAIAGEEGDVIRKMRIGQLQAGSITSYGMGKIDKALRSFSKPMMFNSYAELDYVLEQMHVEITALLEKNGFKVLQWSDAGWLHFFATTPVYTPEDLRKLKIATSPDVPEADDLWKAMRFQPVPLATTDVLLGLQNGLVQAIATPPLFALSQQWFGVAQDMTRILWIPVFGGTLVNLDTWNKIPADIRKEMERVSKELGDSLKEKIRSDYDVVMKAMTDRDLKVHELSETQKKLWLDLVDEGVAKGGAKMFSPEWVQRIESHIQDYRSRQ